MRTDLRTEARTDPRTDLVWRALLPVAAVVALLLDAPQPVAGGLALAALAVAVERLVALRRTGPADRLLVGLGGGLVTLVLLGLLLDVTAITLRPASWVVGLAVVSVAGLVLAAVLPSRAASYDGPREGRRTTLLVLRALPWVAAAVVVTALAVHVSADSLAEADAAPLQLSLGEQSAGTVEVLVSSSEAVGPLELRTSNGDDDVSYPLIDLAAGSTSTTEVALPSSGRFTITLSFPDQTQPLRTLVLDR